MSVRTNWCLLVQYTKILKQKYTEIIKQRHDQQQYTTYR